MLGHKLFLIVSLCVLTACSSAVDHKISSAQAMHKFAYSNCMFWYFKEKGYDTEDIHSISGGIVETSGLSIERFQEIALFIKDYDPKLQTKSKIDKNLLRCFHLEDSKEFTALIGK